MTPQGAVGSNPTLSATLESPLGYDTVSYTHLHTAESVEFYIPFGPIGGPVVLFSPTGVLAKNGEVSIDNVTITIEYGAVSIVLGGLVLLSLF